jgi:hypothetical protein
MMQPVSWTPPFDIWKARWEGDRPPLIGDQFLICPETLCARHAKDGETATNTVFDVKSEKYGGFLGSGETVVYDVFWRMPLANSPDNG